MTCKIVPDMTYNVFGGTLNLAQSQFYIKTRQTFWAVFDPAE